MRKANAVITAVMMLLFVVHGVMGAFQLIGVGDTWHKIIAWSAAALCVIHALIGVKYTVDTLKASKKAGVSYFKENRLFWARRMSGFAVLLMLFFHIWAFTTAVDGATRLLPFGTFRLVTQIFLIICIAVHVITNVKPLLISFGIKSLKKYAFDILFVVSILLLFMAAAFLIYYLRWNVW